MALFSFLPTFLEKVAKTFPEKILDHSATKSSKIPNSLRSDSGYFAEIFTLHFFPKFSNVHKIIIKELTLLLF